MPTKTLVIIPVYNEADKVRKVLTRFTPGLVDTILVVDDGSTDRTPEEIKKFQVECLTHPYKLGVGAAIKDGINYAKQHKYNIIVIMAGNGKDDPQEIPRLINPLLSGKYDYIQGSRYMRSGKAVNMPLFRMIATRIYSLIWSLVTKQRFTDVTNGFRAYKVDIFNNPAININQNWLDSYELEYYLHYKISKLKYRLKEIPVSKTYPVSGRYSKIRPFIDWYRIIKPLLWVIIGIKQ